MSLAVGSTEIVDPAEVERRYRHYRPRVLLWSIVGYSMFYFVRKNLSIAMPVMEEQLHITKSQLGIFLTLHGVLYGFSKFFNGLIGDRVNAPLFMAFGLFFSAIVNVFFGLSASVLAFGIFWMLNGWVQGIGFPPCARLMTHWFSPKELATKMGIWNTSHCIGAASVLILCGWLIDRYNDWRLCFFVPAALAIATSGLLLIYLRDTPESVGLPPVAGTMAKQHKPLRDVLVQRVLSNRHIWLFAIANFFVYTIRYAIFDWGPTLLKQSKGATLGHASWIMAGFEVAGGLAGMGAGLLTDRFFRGRGARTCVFCMLGCVIVLALLWRVPRGHLWASTFLLLAAGVCIYAPQALIGIAAANLATKEAAAAAIGVTGIFGYASTVVSGWGIGYLAEHYGWDYAFAAMLIAAIAGAALFAINWNAPRDGYAQAAPA